MTTVTTENDTLDWATVLPMLHEAGITTIRITAYYDSDERTEEEPEWEGDPAKLRNGIPLDEAVIRWVENELLYDSNEIDGVYGEFEFDVASGVITKVANVYLPDPELVNDPITPDKRPSYNVITEEETTDD